MVAFLQAKKDVNFGIFRYITGQKTLDLQKLN